MGQQQTEPFNVRDAQLVHAGGSTGRVEFKLADGRVVTMPCDIERKPMTGEVEKTEPTDSEIDETLAREQAVHAAEDERQYRKAVESETGGEEALIPPGAEPLKPVETEDELLARERAAHDAAQEESRRLDEERKRAEEEAAKMPPPIE
jgi:hypothetical protein